MIPAIATAMLMSLSGFTQAIPPLDADALVVLEDVRDDLPITGDAAMAALLEHITTWPADPFDDTRSAAAIDDCIASPESMRGSVVHISGVTKSIQRTVFPGLSEVVVTLVRTESDALVAVMSPVAQSGPSIEGRSVEAFARFLKTAHMNVRPLGAGEFRSEVVAVCVGPLPVVAASESSSVASRVAPVVGVLILLVALVMVRILVRSGQSGAVSVQSRPTMPLSDTDLPDEPEEALAELRRRHEEETKKRT